MCDADRVHSPRSRTLAGIEKEDQKHFVPLLPARWDRAVEIKISTGGPTIREGKRLDFVSFPIVALSYPKVRVAISPLLNQWQSESLNAPNEPVLSKILLITSTPRAHRDPTGGSSGNLDENAGGVRRHGDHGTAIWSTRSTGPF